jgi:protein TonB
MRVGLVASSIVHIFAGVLLFFLVAKMDVPTPPDPINIDIEIDHGEGTRANPGSSPESPPGGAPQAAQPAAPAQPPVPQIDQSPPQSEPSAQLSQPPQAPPAVLDAEPLVPQTADQVPRASAPPPAPEPQPTNDRQPQPTQPAKRPDPAPPRARSPQPAPQPAPPASPQPKSELEVHLGDGIGQSVLRDLERPSEPERNNSNPPYPAHAQRRGMRGNVQLLLHIGANGSVVTAEIVESSGYPLLDATAQGWIVRNWRFAPAQHDGKPAPDMKRQNIEFKLE